MIIAQEVLVPRFAKIRQYAVKSLNYSLPYIARQLGVAFAGLTFEITEWKRMSRAHALVTVKVTRDTEEQILQFEIPAKKVPSRTALHLPLLSKTRSSHAKA
ncbi:hypothetical protein [Xanthomonas phage RTH11]|nr:hypothetical protein [Xanthomonas phage RTH11]